jgi:HEAT repeat protein
MNNCGTGKRYITWFFCCLLWGWTVAVTRAECPTPDRPNVSALVERLRSKEKGLRAKAAKDLGDIGPDAKSAVPALTEALKDKEKEVRINAGNALVSIVGGSAVPSLVQAIAYDDYDEKRTRGWEALDLKNNRSRVAPAVPILVTLLKQKDQSVRIEATTALTLIADKTSLAALIELLDDKDDKVRRHAANAFREFGPEAKAAIPGLIGVLKEDFPLYGANTVHPAAWSFKSIGAAAAIPVAEVLRDTKNNDNARDSAYGCLLLMDKEDSVLAVPTLIEVLKDKNRNIRSKAYHVLRCQGPGAKDAKEALLLSIKEGIATDRVYAAAALFAIDPEAKDPVPVFIEALKDKDDDARMRAAVELGHLRSKAKDAALILAETVNDPNPYVQLSAINALQSLGPAAKAAVPTLKAILKDQKEDKMLCNRIRRALKAIEGDN